MAQNKPAPEWTVEEAIARCPQASAVFTRLRMACVGCVMAPFETLAEAAAAYHLEPQALLEQFCESGREQHYFEANRHDEGE